jgi:hypothetical protein
MDWLAVWEALFGRHSGRLLTTSLKSQKPNPARLLEGLGVLRTRKMCSIIQLVRLLNYASLEDEVKLNLAQLRESFWAARTLLQRINDPSFLITFQVLANLWRCTQNLFINLQKFLIICLFRH